MDFGNGIKKYLKIDSRLSMILEKSMEQMDGGKSGYWKKYFLEKAPWMLYCAIEQGIDV